MSRPKTEIDKLVDQSLKNAADNQGNLDDIIKNVAQRTTPEDILKELGALPPGKSADDLKDAAKPRPVIAKAPTKPSNAAKPKISEIKEEIKTYIDPIETAGFPTTGKIVEDYWSVMLRDAPWGDVIAKIPPLTTGLTVTGLQGDFFEVEYNGKTGYSHMNYVWIPGHTPSGIEPPRPPGAPPPKRQRHYQRITAAAFPSALLPDSNRPALPQRISLIGSGLIDMQPAST